MKEDLGEVIPENSSADLGEVRADVVLERGRSEEATLLTSGEDNVGLWPPYSDVGLRLKGVTEEDTSDWSVRTDSEVAEDEDVASDAVEEPVELGWMLSKVFERRNLVFGVEESSSRSGTE